MPKRFAIIILGFAILVAACGGDDDSSQVASLENETTTTVADGSASAAETTEQAVLELTACLRDNGLDIEDPGVDADGNVDFGDFGDFSDIDQEVAEQALNECREYLEGVTLGFQNFDLTSIEDGLLDYAECMRSNGYDLPDPNFDLNAFFGDNGGEGPQGPFGELDPSDPAFAAANAECEYILTQLFSGFAGGSGS